MNVIVDSDALQARYFIDELERVAEDLVRRIDVLDELQGGLSQAQRCSDELNDLWRQINALNRHFRLHV